MTAWQFPKFQQLIINRDCALMTCTALWQKMMLVEHDRQQNYTVRTGLWLRCQSNHTASESPTKCSDLMKIWNWQHFRSRLFESSHQIPQNFTIHPLPLKTQLKNCKLLFEITTYAITTKTTKPSNDNGVSQRYYSVACSWDSGLPFRGPPFRRSAINDDLALTLTAEPVYIFLSGASPDLSPASHHLTARPITGTNRYYWTLI